MSKQRINYITDLPDEEDDRQQFSDPSGSARSKRRLILIFILLIFMFFGVFMRILTITYDNYALVSENQSGRTVTLANSRGAIYDCNLDPFVNLGEEYRIAVQPLPEAIAALEKNIGKERFQKVSAQLQSGVPVVTSADKVSFVTGGIDYVRAPIRTFGRLFAPHIIGYLDGDGINGATGAEYFFNDILREYEGKATVTYKVDAMGVPLVGEEVTRNNTLENSQGGVVLTIDKKIQSIVEAAGEKYLTSGAAVVMEVETGYIKALASFPGYQIEDVSASLNDKAAPLINRALTNYNLGSVFKLATAAAALEAGVSEDFSNYCEGFHEMGDTKFHCHLRSGHGELDLNGGIVKSCNPYFINLALETGGDKLYDMASSLGFDSPIFIANGWKSDRAVMPSEEALADPAVIANTSFGQGELMATPLHVARLVGAVANGGKMMRPTIYQGELKANGEYVEGAISPAQTVFSKETADKIADMMINVIQEGTGLKAKPMYGGAGGKTGTAETGIVSEIPKDDSHIMVYQGWFAGFFPADKPKYVIVVLGEDSKNTEAEPATMFKEIAENIPYYVN